MHLCTLKCYDRGVGLVLQFCWQLSMKGCLPNFNYEVVASWMFSSFKEFLQMPQ